MYKTGYLGGIYSIPHFRQSQESYQVTKKRYTHNDLFIVIITTIMIFDCYYIYIYIGKDI